HGGRRHQPRRDVGQVPLTELATGGDVVAQPDAHAEQVEDRLEEVRQQPVEPAVPVDPQIALPYPQRADDVDREARALVAHRVRLDAHSRNVLPVSFRNTSSRLAGRTNARSSRTPCSRNSVMTASGSRTKMLNRSPERTSSASKRAATRS